eukprot:RCo015236
MRSEKRHPPGKKFPNPSFPTSEFAFSLARKKGGGRFHLRFPTSLLHLRDQGVDLAELRSPSRGIQELAQVVAVVVGAVFLGVVRRSQHGHLVAVNGIVEEESLHLHGDFRGAQVGPLRGELLEHRHRAAPHDLPQPPKLAELVVAHPHILLVGLAGPTDPSAQLCRGNRGAHLLQHSVLRLRLGLRAPVQELLQVRLADAPNRVDICGGAVVLSQVTPQCLVDVGSSQHEHRSGAAHGPGNQLSHEVRHDHPRPGLDVLQGNVLIHRAALALADGHLVADLLPHAADRCGDLVDHNLAVQGTHL